MAEQRLTPEQADQLEAQGAIAPETAARFRPMPSGGPMAEPTPQPVSMPAVDPMAPEPLDTQPAMVDTYIEQGKQMALEKDQAVLEGKLAGLEKRKADLQRRIQEDLSREEVPSKVTGGFLGATIPRTRLTDDQIREKYKDEIAQIEKEEMAIRRQYKGAELQQTGAVPPADVELVSDVQTPDMTQTAVDPMTAAYDQQINVAQDAADIGKARAVEESAYIDQVMKDQKTRFVKEEADLVKRREDMQSKLSALETKSQEIANAAVTREGVEKEYWADKNMGQKILAGIGLLFGAAGGVVGRGNTAVRAINNAIDRDLQAQMNMHKSRRQALMDKKTIYSQMMDLYNDERLALNAAKSASYDVAKLQLEKIKTKYKGQEIQNRADAAIAQLEMEKAKALNQFAYKAGLFGGDTADFNPLLLPEKMQERYVKGFGLARNAKEAAALDDVVKDANNAMSGIQQLFQLANKPLSSISPSDRAKANSIQGLLVGALRLQILGPGTIQEAERELVNQIIANPTKIWSLSSTNKTRLKVLMERIQTNLRNTMRQKIQVPMGGSTKQIREVTPQQRKQTNKARMVKANG